MTSRHLHFVGTMPQFTTAAEAFSWQSAELGAVLSRVSGGETGPRLQWFVPLVEELKRNPKIRTVRDGDWSAYHSVDRLAVRRGSRLRAADVPLRIAEWGREELAVLDAAGTPATAERPLQIGVPGYLDIALFTFGPVGAFRVMTPVLEAIAAQIRELASDRVVFQLEVPAALIAVASAPAVLRARLADLLARLVIRQVSRAPEGTRFGLHLCLGDMGHKAKLQLRSAQPLVVLADALQRHWPRGRRLDFVHLPMSGGDEPPSTDPAFYAPLRSLSLAPTARLVAGYAHEDQALGEQLVVRDLIEQAVGHPVDVATACGLGRRTPGQAAAAVDRMQALRS